MSITLVIIFLLLAAIAATVYIMRKSRGIWRLLKASSVSITMIGFIYQYIEMGLRRIPADMIFKVLINSKKLGTPLELQTLKDFYKLIERNVSLNILDFNQNLFENELQLKRLGSYYVLSGDIESLLKKIHSSATAGKELLVGGNFKSTHEIEKQKIVNNLLKAYQSGVANLQLKFPPVEAPVQTKKGEKPQVHAVQSAEYDSSLELYHTELKSTLKANRIFMSKGESLSILIRQIFENTANSMFIAQQAGLNVQLRDMEVYFGMNGDIEQTLEILLKARHLGFQIELAELERFIVTGADIEGMLQSLINAKKAGLKIELSDLVKYHLLGGDIGILIKALIRAHHEGITLSVAQLSEHFSLGGDINEMANALIKLHQEKIDITINQLSEYQAAGGNIKQLVLDLIKAYQSGLVIPIGKIKSFLAQGGDVEKLINVMIKASRAELDITFDDCEKLARIGTDINLLFEALKIEKRANLNIDKERMIELQIAGGNMHTFAQVLDISNRIGLKINPDELEADLIEGRNVMEIIMAIIHARKEGVEIDYNTAIRLDRAGHKVPQVVHWAIDPQVVNIEPISIVAKDAIDIKLGINVTVRGKIDQYLKGSRENVLTPRVNEAVIKEVERFDNHIDVLESLNLIADRLYRRLTGRISIADFPEINEHEIKALNAKEEKLNSGSAYEILDINIPGIEIGSDALSTIKKELADLDKILAKTHSEKRKATAVALELEAKAKLIEAEAELQRGMAQAFKDGHMSTNEYHKKKIFDDHGPLSYKETKHDPEH